MDIQLFFTTLLAATITMLATGLGAVPFYFFPRLSQKWSRRGYGFAGGVMLAASVFDLIIPALRRGGYSPVAIGLTVGTGVFLLSEVWLGDKQIDFGEIRGASARRVLLILGTLFLHSFPEGVAVGVGYGAGQENGNLGFLLALAISVQNIPEGLAVTLPLRAEKVPVNQCVFWAIFSSVPQPIAAIPALLAVSFFQQILPYGLAFAAGAMGFLVVSELIPEGLEKGDRLEIGTIVAIGFLLMTIAHTLV
ncbi:ZIP family metal transporter [Phormidium sp. CCY1219]|uniref:ZIP family metal transporter n=1 Tax=Phormidium sp. CCY1219 TaxID=2886104 RepID=UPI002D1EC2E4|nr:ZIP family metal transporter [Phormidium sp. CCY1219]MEB3829616.1 ZIP family metal transporter [Phormidium sp. CCY1219]